MIFLRFLLCFFLTLPLLAQDKAAVHGMVVMGTERIYASHLPMFHAPHDYQVIVEIEWDETQQEIYKKAYRQSETKFFTLEPEPFVLPKMLGKPVPFKANLYEGHFERGGKKLLENLEVRIKKVIFQKKFKDKLPTKTIQFLLFGNEKEQFLAHLIRVRPDFDQLFAVQCDLKLLPQKSFYWKIFFPDIPNSAFRKTEATAVFETQWLKLSNMKELYLEYGDLK